MVLATILALAAAAPTVIDAERAFAQLAQDKGQWTAFRATAAADAILFWPSPAKAHEALKGLADPQKAIQWWPTSAWVSCEGRTAVTTGGALWPNGRSGYFTTVWGNGGVADPRWEWSFDHGDFITAPRQAVDRPPVVHASCSKPTGHPQWPNDPFPRSGGKSVISMNYSADKSLQYQWYWLPSGERGIAVAVWNGMRFDVVLDDRVTPPTK